MDQISDFLTRGIANIIPSTEVLEKDLRSGRKLNVFLGIDPTATKIHIGHAFPLRKLQQLVDLGHHVTFLIGDFTALIGDTSDKDTERPVLTSEQIEANFQTYKDQASKILDFSRVTVVHNSDWLSKLNFVDVVKLTRHFSLNDFISRELIKKRLTEGKSVSLPETLYPVMQGYDSYFMDTDLQIGGTDQTFNMQAGRTLQKDLRNKESFVLATTFLEGTDGRKMSKSWGNAIWLTDEPSDMYGKIMSLKDELIVQYFTLATSVTLPEIEAIKTRLATENPMVLKKELAFRIVSELHSKELAESAEAAFAQTFQQGHTPDVIPEFSTPSTDILTLIVDTQLAPSKSEARRLIDQGAVCFSDTKVETYDFQVKESGILKVGSRRFAKIIFK